jgi:hypothetical protein
MYSFLWRKSTRTEGRTDLVKDWMELFRDKLDQGAIKLGAGAQFVGRRILSAMHKLCSLFVRWFRLLGLRERFEGDWLPRFCSMRHPQQIKFTIENVVCLRAPSVGGPGSSGRFRPTCASDEHPDRSGIIADRLVHAHFWTLLACQPLNIAIGVSVNIDPVAHNPSFPAPRCRLYFHCLNETGHPHLDQAIALAAYSIGGSHCKSCPASSCCISVRVVAWPLARAGFRKSDRAC